MSTILATPTNPTTIDPITAFTVSQDTPAPRQSSRLGSILAQSICANKDSSDLSSFPGFEPPPYSPEHLHRLHSSRVGMAFHVFNTKGKLSRRGVVLADTPSTYVVGFADPLTGLIHRKRTLLKSATRNWQWFAGVEESNESLNTPKDTHDDKRTPHFVWNDRSLEQIYFQESN